MRSTQHPSLIEKLDCCGLFAATRRYFQISQHNDSPCFAEKNKIVRSLSTSHNQMILLLYARADFSYSDFALCNPDISQEENAFARSTLKIKADFLQRNAHLLSRLFVYHATQCNLIHAVQDKKKLNVLDMGCGNALSLPGVIAYFGQEKIDYTGVDLDPDHIKACRKIYSRYPNVEFIESDGNQFLRADHNNQKFDVILFQHPNLSAPIPKIVKSFAQMFINAELALAPGGVIYCTFYYAPEAELFMQHIVPKLPDFFKKGHIVTSSVYRDKLASRVGSDIIMYSPENFIFSSAPKPSCEKQLSCKKTV